MEQGWLIKKNKKTKTETVYLALCLQAAAERPKLGERKKKTRRSGGVRPTPVATKLGEVPLTSVTSLRAYLQN